MVTIGCFGFLDCNNHIIKKNCCSNESTSNIDFKTFSKAPDLENCDARTVLPYVLKHRYSFSGGGSVDEYCVAVVVIVSPKQE